MEFSLRSVSFKNSPLRAVLACVSALALVLLGACGAGGNADALQQEHRLSYHGNGSTYGNPPASVQVTTGTTAIVAQPLYLEYPGHQFTNWNDAADGSGNSYLPGGMFLMGTADVTLYAQWQEVNVPTYQVTYFGNGNTAGDVPVDTNEYQSGQMATIANANTLTRTGYLFMGWNTNANGTGFNYLPSNLVTIGTSNLFLHAQWTPEPTVSVSAGNSQLQATWPAVAGAGEYRVYYHTSDDVGSATLWNNVSGTILARSATITGLTNDTTYYVWVAGMVDTTEVFVNANSASAAPTNAGLSTTAATIAPSDNAMGVALDKKLVVPFTMQLNAATVTQSSVLVATGANIAVTVAVGSTGDTIEITPTGGAWSQAMTHTVTINNTVTGTGGETMGEAFVFAFTTLDNADLFGRWTWNNSNADVSGHNRDATVSNVTYNSTALHEGTHALTTSESGNSSVDIGAFEIGDHFTMTTWLQVSDVWTTSGDQTTQTLFSNGGPGTSTDGIRVYIDGNNDADRLVIESGDGNNGLQLVSGTLSNLYGTGHHIVLTVDRSLSTARVYLDGTEVAFTESQFGTPSNFVMPNFTTTSTVRFLCMDNSGSASARLVGDTDDLRFYSRLVTADEARNLARER